MHFGRDWPFSTVVAGRRHGRYWGKNGHQVGPPPNIYDLELREELSMGACAADDS